MWPQVIQFETKQMEVEAQLRLYGEREAAAQAALTAARAIDRRRRPGRLSRLFGRQQPVGGGCLPA